MQVKVISLRVDSDFDRRLRVEAAKRDLDRSAFIRRALVEKLAEIERQRRAGRAGHDAD